ncbi:hypothetical protein M405DRAFT_634728 [Rhizopogon salebrosus TDB-379]|nr:hypothetical protein M405DRAFT_634728 [Rhizopogon salebrosus TDB-379]
MATKRPRKARFAKSSARVLRSSTASTSGVQKQKRKQLAVDVAALEELEQCSEDEVFDMLDCERELDETDVSVDSELGDIQTTHDMHKDLLATKVVDQHSLPVIDMCWGTPTRGKSIPPAHVNRRRDLRPIDMCMGGQQATGIPGEPTEVFPPIDMCWGTATRGKSIDATAIPGEPTEVSYPIDMCWGDEHGDATNGKGVSSIDMCWGTPTETSTSNMHGRHIPLNAADPPLIGKDLNGDIKIDMHWGSTNSTATSTIDMHWGDRPKLGAAVPVAAADAPLISDYINKDIKIDMCWARPNLK